MPITNHSQLVRFSEMCGAEIPRWIRLRLAEFGDDKASIRAFGVDVVGELCQTLLDNGAPGLHFYTLNHAEAPLARAEEHTSELQSLMRTSYAVFCLQKKNKKLIT